jgi:hypothetical protein
VTDTPGLLAALSQIRDEARHAKRMLEGGEAVTGTSALQRIVYMAGDAIDDAQATPEGEKS